MLKLRSILPLLTCALLLVPSAVAQQGQIAFEKTSHDFGQLTEGDVPTHTFTFENEGTAPLRLLMVRTSCGCTTPEWTKEAVEPGESGVITVAYNSEGRPGSFHRTINVFSDGQPDEVVLHVNGTVGPKPLTSGIAQGNLLFESVEADLGELSAGEAGIATIRLRNTGAAPVLITSLEAANNLSISYPGEPIAPGELAIITVSVNTEGKPAGADFIHAVALSTDDPEQPEKSIRVTGRMK